MQHSTTMVNHQPSPQQHSLWHNGQQPPTGEATRKKRQRSVVLVLFLSIVSFIQRLCVLVLGLLRLSYRKTAEHQAIRYYRCPLSPLSESRLLCVKRKVLVLDLDETLIHSHHDGCPSPLRPATPPDFIVRVWIENQPVRFFVHKRPHVDFFLSMVSQWYDVVIFTASMEMYGMAVANKLERNGPIFKQKYFRQDCRMDFNGYIKDLTTVSSDLSSIL